MISAKPATNVPTLSTSSPTSTATIIGRATGSDSRNGACGAA